MEVIYSDIKNKSKTVCTTISQVSINIAQAKQVFLTTRTILFTLFLMQKIKKPVFKALVTIWNLILPMPGSMATLFLT